MLKTPSITAAFALATISTAAIASPAETHSFVHDGESYSYSIEQKANTRVIRGKVDKTGQSFVLYVGDRRVTGTVNGRPVSFERSEVKKLAPKVQVASR